MTLYANCQETIYMKCQSLLYGKKNKKNISKCCLLKFLPRVLSIKMQCLLKLDRVMY